MGKGLKVLLLCITDMHGFLICYSLEKSQFTQVERNRFRKELLGYNDFSNKGKYKYYRSGLLDEIPHNKLIRSVLVIKKEDHDKIVSFLDKYNARYFVREVKLTKEDMDKLKIYKTE